MPVATKRRHELPGGTQMAGFIQIIEWKTSRIDEVKAHQKTFSARRDERDVEGPQRITVTADRNRPGTYLTIVEFSSAEAAKANSEHPFTAEFVQGMMALCDGPPTYYDLDVMSTEVLLDATKAKAGSRS